MTDWRVEARKRCESVVYDPYALYPVVRCARIALRALAELDKAAARNAELERLLADEKMEHGILIELLGRPEIDDFQEGVILEAAHQRQRWGDAHDRDKSAENWFWLVGYLAGKALRSAITGNYNHAKHHTISAAAALFQWHKAIGQSANGVGADADLNPDAKAEGKP